MKVSGHPGAQVITMPSQSASSLLSVAPPMYSGQEAGVPGMSTLTDTVHLPGGESVTKFLHPVFTIFERQYSVLPDEGWFQPSVNPRNPIQFQLGSFEVPKDQCLWLFDYEFFIMRPSGLDPGDWFRAEEGRFSNVLGFDLTFTGRREANTSYSLDPAPVQVQRPEFEVQVGQANAGQFNRSAANSFASTASAGTSLLPVRDTLMGARGMPFTIIAKQNTRVAMNTVIFRPVQSPIAAVVSRMGGYLLHHNLSESLMNRVRPK